MGKFVYYHLLCVHQLHRMPEVPWKASRVLGRCWYSWGTSPWV